MGTNPSQGQTPDQSNQYGSGYTGYTPPTQNDASSSPQYGDTSSGQEDYQYGQYTYDQGQQQQQQYQYGAYQPPQSALHGRSRASGANDPTSLGMNGKTAAAASYVLLFLSGIVIFLLERKNRFVRFCAAQSTLFFGAVFIVYVILRFLTVIPVLGFLLSPLIGCATGILILASVLLWAFLTIQAYRGVKVKLPFFGDYAESLVARFTKR